MKNLFVFFLSLMCLKSTAQITSNNIQTVAYETKAGGYITTTYTIGEGFPIERKLFDFDTSYYKISCLDSSCITVDTSQRFLTVNKYGTIEIRTLSSFSVHTDTCSTTSGIAVFYLTNDGTNSGTALYPNGNIWPHFIINDVSKVYAFSWILSNSNRTLTVTVKYQDHDFMSGLYMTNAANNTLVRMTVTGN